LTVVVEALDQPRGRKLTIISLVVGGLAGIQLFGGAISTIG
jgi:hypothetical protein